MKRILQISTVCALLLLLLCSCSLVLGEYSFTFVLGDGRDNVTTEVSAVAELYEPEPYEEGRVFGGWYLDAECTEPYLLTRHTSDTTLYALWINEGSHSLTLIYGDGRQPTRLTYEGTAPDVAAPTRIGYEFVCWQSSTGEQYDPSTECGSSIILTAVWRQITPTATVTISVGGGAKDISTTVDTGVTVAPPEPPERPGYSFLGWYSDVELLCPFDFDKPIYGDLTLYAKWEADESVAVNLLGTEVLRSAVRISVKRTERIGIGQYKTSTTGGSGVVFAEGAGGVYYCLTNDHVAGLGDSYSVEHTVYDAYGSAYVGGLIYSDPVYDLSIISFYSSAELYVSGFAAKDASLGERVYSIGNPNGLINSFTAGVVDRIEPLDISGSEVVFDVAWHTAPIDSGSSGGGVFNGLGELVGINYAASERDGEFEMSFYIPLARVLEFISAAEESLGTVLIPSVT